LDFLGSTRRVIRVRVVVIVFALLRMLIRRRLFPEFPRGPL
jgi:hypothetical protein